MKFLLSIIFSAWAIAASTQTFNVNSPDGNIRVNVKLTDRIYYNVEVDGQEVMWYSPISMTTNRGVLGRSPKLISSNITSTNELIKTVWGIRKQIDNNYNELTLEFQQSFSLIFRIFNDGVAYRFNTQFKGEMIVLEEEVEFRFWDNFNMINHVVNAFDSSYEEIYSRQKILDVTPSNLVSLPSIVDQGNLKLAILESDVFNYPGMYLSKTIAHTWPYLNGKFPKYPIEWKEGGHNRFNLKVTKTADFIAKTIGNRSFPWRILAVARHDVELADSDLVYRLSRPEQISTDWIKPGKVAWDWWNALNLTGVNFETGVNNRTYEYFIDFAANNGIEYVILDEGWSDQFDVLLPTPHVDMEHLTAYARQKGVGLILWCVWHTIDRQYKEAFKLFHQWGVKGIKVDFIDRDDQLAVEFYERLAKEAANYQLLVDFHGCSKPTGLDRTFPNLITYEAVRGNEYNKFSSGPEPGHNVDLVFTRMMAGPMDYTPGAMKNSIQGDFNQSNQNPMSKGTRCHQLAMYVIYFSPLQMLCDAPTAYEKYPDILTFLKDVPVSWDETVVLDGKIGEYVIIARKKGDNWYVGGLTNWSERDVEIKISDFANGIFNARTFKDGANANRMAEDYRVDNFEVSSSDKVKINMKKGGGFVMVLEQLKR